MKKVKNFFGKVKEVKAPLKWKSSKNSPPTQLAYITQPEIDMLVKANLHGSMNGKPNMGPKGIMSLDGGGIEEAYSEKISSTPFSSNVISSGSNINPHDNFNVSTNQGSGNNYGQGNVDPGLQAAVNAQASNTQATLPPSMGFQPKDPSQNTIQDYINQGITNQNQIAAQSMLDAGITNLAGSTPGVQGTGSGNLTTTQGSGIVLGEGDDNGDDGTDDGTDDEKLTEEEKKEDEAKKKAKKTAEWLTDWWADQSGKTDYKGYRKYGDRKSIFSGGIRNTQAKVTAKIQDKLNKGYYKIVDGPNGEPLIIHASTGTPVNPFTGHIVDTQSQGAQGGAYQNDMARALGIDEKHAGVFSREYQTGNGLAVQNMKPEHALRFLMKKNKGAFEQFFSMNKDKAGFNPFSASAISGAMGFLLNKITGPEALQVGNNLERAGWGKAIKGEDGKYTIRLTEDGAQNWSNSFNVPDYVSSEAIAKDKSKGWLSDILGTKKFPDQPIDLSNLIDVGGTVNPANVNQFNNPMYNPTDPSSPNFDQRIGNPDFVQPPDLVTPYPFVPSFTPNMNVTGTPSSFTNVGGSTTNYPAFTSDGYKIGASVANQNQIQNQGGGGQGGGQSGNQGDDQDTTTTQGPLTFDAYGRPVTYDYTGGPEQIYLGGGYKRDGSYIGSPWGFSKGGIANFKPYGY